MIVLIKSDNWLVKKITRDEAMNFTLKNHYLKTFPIISWNYGLFLDEELRGVVVFCSPSSPNIIDIFDGSVKKNELMQLSRLVLPKNSIKNEGSFLLSRAIKLFKNDRPLVKCLITYCDIERGNLGTVFKAANWIDFGFSSVGGPQGYKNGNKFYHSRHLKLNSISKLVKIKRSKKIRYVFYYSDFGTKGDFLSCFNEIS